MVILPDASVGISKHGAAGRLWRTAYRPHRRVVRFGEARRVRPPAISRKRPLRATTRSFACACTIVAVAIVHHDHATLRTRATTCDAFLWNLHRSRQRIELVMFSREAALQHEAGSPREVE
jgi:hypothetical protein